MMPKTPTGHWTPAREVYKGLAPHSMKKKKAAQPGEPKTDTLRRHMGGLIFKAFHAAAAQPGGAEGRYPSASDDIRVQILSRISFLGETPSRGDFFTNSQRYSQ